jgi:hypothetical protein
MRTPIRFKQLFVVFIIMTAFASLSYAQSDLDKLLNESKGQDTVYALATFKATRIVNTQTVASLNANHLDFRIHHRFGTLNSGIDQFWGLDQATIKL